MKKFCLFFGLLVSAVAITSCSVDRQTAASQETIEATGLTASLIAENSLVLEGMDGDISLNASLVKAGLQEHLKQADLNADFTDIRIVSEEVGNSIVHVLRAKDFSNGIDTSVTLEKRASDGKFVLRRLEGTCSCKSKSCATSWGCNANGSGTTCACTSCQGDCEKTSTSLFGEFMIGFVAENF